MFDLRFIDRRKKLARIRLDAFEEDFRVSLNANTTALEREWRRMLAAVLGRKKKVALPVWRSGRMISRAWLFYRIGDVVFIRDRVFVSGFNPKRSVVPKRETAANEDLRVSEWSVDVAAISDFLKRPNQSPQHNAGAGPATSDEASAPHRAPSSKKAARTQPPRG